MPTSQIRNASGERSLGQSEPRHDGCVHYTPKHASWLDMAEIELSVLTRQCLDRRIPDKATLVREVSAWMHDRNFQQSGIDWRFTTPHARIKLKRLYPAILP